MATPKRISLRIAGMHCPSCAKLIEKSLRGASDIEAVYVSFPLKRAIIEYDPGAISPRKIAEAIRSLGYRAEAEEKESRVLLWSFVTALVLSTPLLLLTYFVDVAWEVWIALLLATVIEFGAGFHFFAGSYRALKAKMPDLNTLVVLSTLTAYVYSAAGALYGHEHVFYSAIAIIVTIITLGKLIERAAGERASETLLRLLELQPRIVTVVRKGHEIEVPADEVEVGDAVLIKPGERIPIDGEVIGGESTVDESLLTGESIPIDKVEGDSVYAGTLNLSGFLKLRATAVGERTTLSHLINLLERASSSRAPIQRIADKVCAVFVPLVTCVALLSASIWLLLGMPSHFVVSVFATVLIVACPCAFGLATPLAIATGIGEGAKRGILFKDAEVVERLARCELLAFDKTGTLTEGKVVVTDVLGDEALFLAAVAEKQSEHPFAKAIVERANREGLKIPDPESFKPLFGKGVQAIYRGKRIAVGSTAFMHELEIDFDHLEREMNSLVEQGKTVLIVSCNSKAVGLVALRDSVRKEAGDSTASLKKLGFGTIMLTGDHEKVAKSIAEEMSIEFRANMLPEDKVRTIEELRKKACVAMVGDGVNDAPALMAADVGMAIGSGADITVEAADVVLTRSSIEDVVKAVEIARKTVRKAKQNIAYAFAYNAIALAVAMGIFYPFIQTLVLSPSAGAFLMALSNVFVVTNSLHLKRSLA